MDALNRSVQDFSNKTAWPLTDPGYKLNTASSIRVHPKSSDTSPPLEEIDDAIAPDVACYLTPTSEDGHWFGISYYIAGEAQPNDPENVWDDDDGTVIHTQSFEFTENSGAFSIAATDYDGEITNGAGYWSYATPSTGSTICLRYPNYSQGTEYEIFGLGWVEGVSSISTYVGDGVIP